MNKKEFDKTTNKLLELFGVDALRTNFCAFCNCDLEKNEPYGADQTICYECGVEFIDTTHQERLERYISDIGDCMYLLKESVAKLKSEIRNGETENDK